MEKAPGCAPAVPVGRFDVWAYQFPTDGLGGLESDGTFTGRDTTCVVVPVTGGGRTGLGCTYGDIAAARLIDSALAEVAVGSDALCPAQAWHSMPARLRNAGRPGIGTMAVAAVDIALWDLRARLLDQPLYRTLPAFRDQVPVYGSGGFTNYPLDRLADQLAGGSSRASRG